MQVVTERGRGSAVGEGLGGSEQLHFASHSFVLEQNCFEFGAGVRQGLLADAAQLSHAFSACAGGKQFLQSFGEGLLQFRPRGMPVGCFSIHFSHFFLQNFEPCQHFLPVSNAERLYFFDAFFHKFLSFSMLALLLLFILFSICFAALWLRQPLPNSGTQLVVAFHERLVITLLFLEKLTQLGEALGHVGRLGMDEKRGGGEMGREAFETGGEAGEGGWWVDDEGVEGSDALAHLVDVLSFLFAEQHDLSALLDYIFEKTLPHSQQSTLQSLPSLSFLQTFTPFSKHFIFSGKFNNLLPQFVVPSPLLLLAFHLLRFLFRLALQLVAILLQFLQMLLRHSQLVGRAVVLFSFGSEREGELCGCLGPVCGYLGEGVALGGVEVEGLEVVLDGGLEVVELGVEEGTGGEALQLLGDLLHFLPELCVVVEQRRFQFGLVAGGELCDLFAESVEFFFEFSLSRLLSLQQSADHRPQLFLLLPIFPLPRFVQSSHFLQSNYHGSAFPFALIQFVLQLGDFLLMAVRIRCQLCLQFGQLFPLLLVLGLPQALPELQIRGQSLLIVQLRMCDQFLHRLHELFPILQLTVVRSVLFFLQLPHFLPQPLPNCRCSLFSLLRFLAQGFAGCSHKFDEFVHPQQCFLSLWLSLSGAGVEFPHPHHFLRQHLALPFSCLASYYPGLQLSLHFPSLRLHFFLFFGLGCFHFLPDGLLQLQGLLEMCVGLSEVGEFELVASACGVGLFGEEGGGLFVLLGEGGEGAGGVVGEGGEAGEFLLEGVDA